jgi:hypothetical protein
MPFNPTLPAPNSPILSAELRDQFNGIKALVDEKLPASEKGVADGVASLDGNGRLVQPADWNSLANKPSPVADGTYTVGLGAYQNGTITVVNGIITGIQEASDSPPATPVFVGSNFEDGPCNGNWYIHTTPPGYNTYRNADSTRFCSRDVQAGVWFIGSGLWPDQGNQSYNMSTPNDPPLGSNWSSNFWLFPGTTSAA